MTDNNQKNVVYKFIFLCFKNVKELLHKSHFLLVAL